MGYLREHGIKAICFDIDGTLYPKWRTDLYLVLSALRHPFFSMKYNKTRQIIRKEDGLDGEKGLSVKDFRLKEARVLGFDDLDKYCEKYNRCIYNPWQKEVKAHVRAFKEVKETLLEAKEKGYLLAALSDFPIGNKLSSLGLEGIFDYVASTEDSGYLKPNRVPFDSMLSSLGVSPNEALYCGDSYRKDVQGARNAGLHALLLPVSEGKAKDYPDANLVLTGWDKFSKIVL